jgi:lipopolysaccharide/colanic/teichoic acid biosynthesis glycosyltransferase
MKRSGYETAKRAMDVAVSVVALILLAPLFVAIAIAIRLDSPGPVIFSQVRVGHNGKPIRVLKWRTMVAGNDESLHRNHYEQLTRTNGTLYLENDPRVTRVGRVLRATSLDELPNLLNVLTGELSLVGPRPLVTYEHELLSAEAQRRTEVKPGITGWAQIQGRGDLTIAQRSTFDLEYLEQRSLLLDLQVLVRTIPALIRQRGV